MIRESILQLKASKKAIPAIIVMVTITQSIVPLLQAWSPDPYPDYDIFIVPFVEHCDIFSYPERDGVELIDNSTAVHSGKYEPTRNPLKWWFNCVSYKIFDTPKLIPILFNIGLMPLVYLLSLQITKDKIIALLSFGAFTANPLYSEWISSGTYDQVWSFFLVLSIYSMYRVKDAAMPFAFLALSLSAKTLGLLYLPSWFYSYVKSSSPRQIKIMSTVIFFIVLSIVYLTYHGNVGFILGGEIGFHPENMHDILFRNFEMLYPIVPFLVAFVLLSTNFRPSKPLPYKRLCAIWMINGLMTTVLIYLFSSQFQFVYRFVPFAVFMSLFIGVTIVDTANCILELILKRQARHEK